MTLAGNMPWPPIYTRTGWTRGHLTTERLKRERRIQTQLAAAGVALDRNMEEIRAAQVARTQTLYHVARRTGPKLFPRDPRKVSSRVTFLRRAEHTTQETVMRRLLLTAAIVWIMLAKVGIPMLENWDMGSSVNSIGHDQIRGSR